MVKGFQFDNTDGIEFDSVHHTRRSVQARELISPQTARIFKKLVIAGKVNSWAFKELDSDFIRLAE